MSTLTLPDNLVAVHPPVRSSDWNLCCDGPLTYFLARRLGIVPRFRWSKALSRGTWMHHILEHCHLVPHVQRDHYIGLGAERIIELNTICTDRLIDGDARTQLINRERQDMDCAWAWWAAASTVRIRDGKTFLDHIQAPHWEPLCRECILRTTVEGVDCVAQPDLLLYHKVQDKVWIVDLKSTALDPVDRLSTITHEFQPFHYMSVVNSAIRDGSFHVATGLSPSATLGGIIHIAIRKPSIEFGMRDRPWHLDTTPLKSGPRKGQPRNEKIYLGEPSLPNYIQRCTDWYLAQEDYAHLEPEWAASPPVNVSHTTASLLTDPWHQAQHHARLAVIDKYRTLMPDPTLFPAGPSLLTPSGKPHTYAPFITTPPSQWGDIMAGGEFIIARRDPTTEPDGILPIGDDTQ